MSSVGDSPSVKTDTEQSGSNKWWIPIFLLAINLPLAIALFLVLEILTPYLVMEGGSPYQYIFYVLIALGWLLTFISPIAVYFDRQYVASTSEWTPSKLYYLMIIPSFVNVILAIVYSYNRHKYVGIP